MHRSIAMLVLVCVSAACTSPLVGGAEPIRIAYFQDGTVPNALELVASASLAMDLAVQQAVALGDLPKGSQVVTQETEGDPDVAVALAREVAADPTYVAAIEAPFWTPVEEARRLLEDAGIPILSLSTLGESGGGMWRRLVATLDEEAVVAGALAPRGTPQTPRIPCAASDGTSYSMDAMEHVLGATGQPTTATLPASRTVAATTASMCSVVYSTGFSTRSIDLRKAMDAARLSDTDMVVLDASKTDAFLRGAAGAGGVTIAVCACVDVSTSDVPRSMLLVHDFQAATGITLGSFGVEGWDAGRLLVSWYVHGARGRAAFACSVDDLEAFRGLAGPYAFGRDGELTHPRVIRYRAVGVRWLLESPGLET